MTVNDLTVNGTTILGDAAADSLTINAATLSLANASRLDLANTSTTSLNIESGLLNLDTTNSRVGIGTTAPSARLHSQESGAKTAANYANYLENISTNATTDGITKYGSYISSTGNFVGGTGPGTRNFGLYLDTSSGADSNYSAYFADNVGIGTTAPLAGLTIGTGSNTNAQQTNSLYVSGNLEVDGSTWLGDAAADVLTVTGTFSAPTASMTVNDLTVNGTTILGDAAADSLTINAATLSLANASRLDLANTSTTSLNIESGLLNLDTTNSRVGIGTTGPDSPLDVLSTTGTQLRLTYTDGSVYTTLNTDASGNLNIDATGTKTVIADDLQITGNDILSSTATAITLSGADTTLAGDLAVNGGDLTTTATTFNLLNSTATTVNFAGAGTTISLGAATGTTTLNHALSVKGTTTLGDASADALTINAATLSLANASTLDLANTSTTSL
ncbi:MAG: hypothetical protein AABY92_07145, partial [Thermodesulfobacteriota bacterium]